MSLNNKSININEHLIWYNKNKDKTYINLIFDDKKVIGYVRLDKVDITSYKLSYMLIREFHGKKIMGRVINNTILEKLNSIKKKFINIHAITFMNNTKSKKLLKKLNFKLSYVTKSQLIFSKKYE